MIFGIILALTDKIADVLANANTDVQDLIEAKEPVVTETIDAQASQVMEETDAVNDAGSENTMIYSALQGDCSICFDTCVGRSEDQGVCNTGCSGNTSEETVDMPVPQIQGQSVEVVKTTPRERASERDVEHIVDVPVPQVMEETMEVMQSVPREQIQEHILEIVEVIQLVPRRQVQECIVEENCRRSSFTRDGGNHRSHEAHSTSSVHR